MIHAKDGVLDPLIVLYASKDLTKTLRLTAKKAFSLLIFSSP